MTFRLGHANIQQTDSSADERATVNEVAGRSDVVTWNEALSAGGHLDALKKQGFNSAKTSVGLAISWRVSKFDFVDRGIKMVMKGGYVGADGTPKGPDNRRVGPNRYVLWVLLRERATGKLVIVSTHHSVAKADTDNKWRRSIRAKGWAATVAELRRVQKAHPDAALILGGDFNTIGKLTAFAALGVTEAKTPATYGKKLRYDRWFTRKVTVTGIVRYRTKSDHWALASVASLTSTATSSPAPKPKPKPKTTSKPKGKTVATENSVTRAHEEFELALLHWFRGNEHLRDANPDRRVVRGVLKVLASTRQGLLKQVSRLPRS